MWHNVWAPLITGTLLLIGASLVALLVLSRRPSRAGGGAKHGGPYLGGGSLLSTLVTSSVAALGRWSKRGEQGTAFARADSAVEV